MPALPWGNTEQPGENEPFEAAIASAGVRLRSSIDRRWRIELHGVEEECQNDNLDVARPVRFALPFLLLRCLLEEAG